MTSTPSKVQKVDGAEASMDSSGQHVHTVVSHPPVRHGELFGTLLGIPGTRYSNYFSQLL